MNGRPLRFATALSALLLGLAFAGPAQAQSVVVQGQVQVQPYGSPQGSAQPPPGYGVQGQVYVQPTYQPNYAPTYARRQPQLRYEDRETTIKGLWIPGVIIFGVSWGLTSVFASSLSFSDDYATWSFVPLVGPWVALGYANTDAETTGSVIAGIAQTAGLAMFVLGLSLTRTVRVATYSLGDEEQAPRLAFDLLPTPGGARAGLTLSHF